MRKFNIKAQIHKLYTLTTVGYFRIAGASWVALLALRGFSMFEIGMLESIFHIVSSSFEIPSGVVADVFGIRRKREGLGTELAYDIPESTDMIPMTMGQDDHVQAPAAEKGTDVGDHPA